MEKQDKRRGSLLLISINPHHEYTLEDGVQPHSVEGIRPIWVPDPCDLAQICFQLTAEQVLHALMSRVPVVTRVGGGAEGTLHPPALAIEAAAAGEGDVRAQQGVLAHQVCGDALPAHRQVLICGSIRRLINDLGRI